MIVTIKKVGPVQLTRTELLNDGFIPEMTSNDSGDCPFQ